MSVSRQMTTAMVVLPPSTKCHPIPLTVSTARDPDA
jgi:hypothetical protein